MNLKIINVAVFVKLDVGRIPLFGAEYQVWDYDLTPPACISAFEVIDDALRFVEDKKKCEKQREQERTRTSSTVTLEPL